MKESKTLWAWARITFYLSILFWFMSLTIDFDGFIGFIYSIAWIIDSHIALILAIFHLNKYDKKGFAITSVVIMGFLVVLFFIGIMRGLYGL